MKLGMKLGMEARMERVCAVSGVPFKVTEEESQFYQKMGVPLPTLCPIERLRRRMSYRNFRNLYRRRCDATGQEMLSMYEASERAPFPVYEKDYWWSDQWDAKQFGRDFDFSRPFFPQYHALSRQVPRFNVANIQSENSSYSNHTLQAKNCFLVFGCVRNEDCLYGHIVWECKNCVDNLYIFRCEWCSQSVDLVDCYDVHYSSESTNCQECSFLHNCQNCRNCFGSVNLRNKQYVFFNEQLSKDAYLAEMKKISPFSEQTIMQATEYLHMLRQGAAYPSYFGLKCENVSGNHLYESSNLQYCFDVKKSEHSKYAFTGYGLEHCYDISFTGASSRFCVDCLTLSSCEEVRFSHLLNDCSNICYSEFCFSSYDLFGCNGLRRAEYCILNKQYSKDEYHQLKARIIEHMQSTGEWGEFFPMQISPFAYNESIASEYLPLTKDEVLARGLGWRDEDSETEEEVATPQSVASLVDPYAEEVCKLVFACESSGKRYKIIKPELSFYRRMKLPLPVYCPEVRHLRRMSLRAPRQLALRSCGTCWKEFLTAHTSDFAPNVLCEECYSAMLY